MGFLLIFLQYYPQRKRLLLQQLYIKSLGADKNIKDSIKDAIKKTEKEDIIIFKVSIKTFNFLIFFYAIIIFSVSIFSLIWYIFYNNISNNFIYLLIIFTLIGYWGSV